MLGIFWRTIIDRKRSLLVYLVTAVGLVWMYILFYPSVETASQQVSDLVKMLPKEFNQAFGIDPRSFTTFEGFIAGKHFSMVWPMIMVMLISGFASGSIAGEVEKGTIELVLAQPISRAKIVFSKVLAGIFINLVFAAVSILAVIPLAKAYGIEVPQTNFILLSAIGFCFGLAVFGLSMLASAYFSEKGKALFLTIGVLLAMYVANIVALLKASLENVKFASYFYYFDYAGMLLDGKIGIISVWVFGAAFLALTAIGIFWFTQRDIKD